MNRILSAFLLLIAIAVAGPLAAQDKGLEISVFGVANAPLQKLNPFPNIGYGGPQPAPSVGYVGFKSGFGGGLGATYVLEKNFAVRADFAFAGSNLDVPSTVNLGGGIASTSWTRTVLGGDFVLRLPAGNLVPYFTTGAGVVMLKESGGRKSNRMAGRFGAGLKFPIGDKLGAFAQVNSNIYDFDQRYYTYFTKVQVDLMLSAGVSIRVL